MHYQIRYGNVWSFLCVCVCVCVDMRPWGTHGCVLICAHSAEIRRACAAMRLGWLSARARAPLTEILSCGGTMLRLVKSSAYMHYRCIYALEHT